MKRGDKSAIERTFAIRYVRDVSRSKFYPKVREVVEREMPLRAGETIELNLQTVFIQPRRAERLKPGYELDVEVEIKPGDEFQSKGRGYLDETRFPARIRAAATALRDSGNIGLYSISHRESVFDDQATSGRVRAHCRPSAARTRNKTIATAWNHRKTCRCREAHESRGYRVKFCT